LSTKSHLHQLAIRQPTQNYLLREVSKDQRIGARGGFGEHLHWT